MLIYGLINLCHTGRENRFTNITIISFIIAVSVYCVVKVRRERSGSDANRSRSHILRFLRDRKRFLSLYKSQRTLGFTEWDHLLLIFCLVNNSLLLCFSMILLQETHLTMGWPNTVPNVVIIQCKNKPNIAINTNMMTRLLFYIRLFISMAFKEEEM